MNARRKRLVKNVVLGTETEKRRPLPTAGCDVDNGTEAGAPVPAATHSSLIGSVAYRIVISTEEPPLTFAQANGVRRKPDIALLSAEMK